MDSIIGALGKAGPGNPVYTYAANITEIVPDTDETLLNISAGYYLVADAIDLPWDQTVLVGMDAAKFANLSWYGAMATSAFWVPNTGGYYYCNSMLFAPKTIDWTDFATECNAGLETEYGISGTWGYTLTMNALANGYSLTSPVMGFGNNTEVITINATYNFDGVMTSYTMEYGDDLLLEIVMTVTEPPEISHPADFTVPNGYTGESINWTASSLAPKNYAILINGTAEVLAIPWLTEVIVFDIPDGLEAGDYLIRIVVADTKANTAFDEVVMTVEAAHQLSLDLTFF
jgi:hypothetical protein